MHSSPEDTVGRCVTATARFVPAISTEVEMQKCNGANCFAIADGNRARRFARKYDLPEDPIWCETINDPVETAISLRETEATDNVILSLGVVVAVAAVLAVVLLRRLYHKQLAAG